MSFIQEQQKNLMLKRLREKAELSSKDINDIVYAYQIATGNATGVGRLKGIITYLNQYGFISFVKENETILIKDKYQLAQIVKSFDTSIDLTISRFLRDYFQ